MDRKKSSLAPKLVNLKTLFKKHPNWRTNRDYVYIGRGTGKFGCSLKLDTSKWSK